MNHTIITNVEWLNPKMHMNIKMIFMDVTDTVGAHADPSLLYVTPGFLSAVCG